MKENDLCIIAPGSPHDLSIEDESIVICIMLRKSTFNKTFMPIMPRDNLLDHFFRIYMMGENAKTNYLLFSCQPSRWLRQIVINAMAESYKCDSCGNICCVSWLEQLFSHLLRNDRQSIEMYDYRLDVDFTPILQFMQAHYHQLSLSSLAGLVHYSEPYLSALIKQNTGKNFSELIRDFRLSEAAYLLINTNMNVSTITKEIGYNSPDHFSRIFRSQYGLSPKAFRKKFAENTEPFIPFQFEETPSQNPT